MLESIRIILLKLDSNRHNIVLKYACTPRISFSCICKFVLVCTVEVLTFIEW